MINKYFIKPSFKVESKIKEKYFIEVNQQLFWTLCLHANHHAKVLQRAGFRSPCLRGAYNHVDLTVIELSIVISQNPGATQYNFMFLDQN